MSRREKKRLQKGVAEMARREKMKLRKQEQKEKEEAEGDLKMRQILQNKTRFIGEQLTVIDDNAEKLLSELEKELKINRNNFGDETILYTYYAFEGEYKEYSMTVEYFLHNFSIIKNANKIMEEWLEERSQKGYADHLMEFLIEDYCPRIEVFGGDPIFYEGEE